jgi:hypothetical protein
MLNLTPHPITVCGVTYPPSGTVARVIMDRAARAPLNGVPVSFRIPGGVSGVPGPEAGPVLVSGMVIDALAGQPGCDHVFAPDTGPTAIRDESGHIVGVVGLIGVSRI